MLEIIEKFHRFNSVKISNSLMHYLYAIESVILMAYPNSNRVENTGLEREPGGELGTKIGSSLIVFVFPLTPKALNSDHPVSIYIPHQVAAGVLRCL